MFFALLIVQWKLVSKHRLYAPIFHDEMKGAAFFFGVFGDCDDNVFEEILLPDTLPDPATCEYAGEALRNTFAPNGFLLADVAAAEAGLDAPDLGDGPTVATKNNSPKGSQKE